MTQRRSPSCNTAADRPSCLVRGARTLPSRGQIKHSRMRRSHRIRHDEATMLSVIATDEAGYGPNLGPLVISATVWQVDDEAKARDLYRVLRKVVCSTPAKATARRVAMADSKLLYKPGEIHDLERGALAALSCVGHQCGAWRELWRFLDSSV